MTAIIYRGVVFGLAVIAIFLFAFVAAIAQEGKVSEVRPSTNAQSIATQFQRPAEGMDRVKARKNAVAAVLKKKPNNKPGESFAYSNVGVTIAAAMVEEKTGKSWEDLIRQEIFAPMNMTHAGFGPPKDGKTPLDQPRGHQNLGLFKRSVGENDDNSPIMGPAGFIHLTLEELSAFGNSTFQAYAAMESC